MDTDSEWASEPIAVIGMGCKFAGGSSNPDKLWDLMASGQTGWSAIPEDRRDLRGVYHPNHERTNTSHVKGGHFLDEDVAAFDAAFFNYSAEMAQTVDPQFRLQLESTYEALENAGLPLSEVMGSQTSVFAGVFTHDYQEGIIRDEDRLPRFNVVGTWDPMSSNRTSHFFDFRGASMTLETGCSTTLVALHQAVHSLRSREAGMSVVTGANVMLNPDTFKVIGSLGMLSPDGRCFAFDARANGYGRGEGVATIVIKRLSDALANNDPIRAVIRETALNQDGKTDTITTPSSTAHIELMRECYLRAGLDPRGTQYFEAHGTGTPAGDPIEAGAMAAVFSQGPGREIEEHYMRIGSVKTNIGHTEAASGVAAIVKGVLCLEKGLIPPTVNYERPNPKLKLDEWHLKVVREVEQWPESLVDGPRRMSINNFGYGGANAHVILENADPWTQSLLDLPVNGNGHTNGTGNGYSTNDDAKVLVFSACDERGCQKMVENVKAYLESRSSLEYKEAQQLLRNLSYILGERRALFSWVAAHQIRLDRDGRGSSSLKAVIQALDAPNFKPIRRATDSPPRIGMLFTGQGAQWHAMGRELLTSYPVFRQSIDEAEAHLRDLGADWSLLEELQRDKAVTKVHSTKIGIPICVALQIALVCLLESWGIKPAAVASHSSGEISAAFAVGALTHRQAIATAYYRAILVAAADEKEEKEDRQTKIPGAMAAVGLGVEAVQLYIDQLAKTDGKAVVGCINSPESVTISGDRDAVQKIEDLCKQDGVFARRLRVQQDYHSHHMDPFAEDYRERLRLEMARDGQKKQRQGMDQKQSLKAIFSSAVTGGRMTNIKDIASPDHWVGSLVQPVEFVDAFTDMVLGDLDESTGRSVDVLLEVGPHTALGGPIREILSSPALDGLELPYWGSLVRDEHAGDSMRAAVTHLFEAGLPLSMSAINFPELAHDEDEDERGLQVLTDLPSYPWNHSRRHWQESRINHAINRRSQPPHELLGMRVAGTDPRTAVWRRVLRVSQTPWVCDHVVQGSILFPGSGYVCLAIEAARQLQQEKSEAVSGVRLRDVHFLLGLVVPDNADGVEIHTTLTPVSDQDQAWQRFEVSSVTLDNRWTLHAKGLVRADKEGAVDDPAPPHPLSTYTRSPDPQDLFANLWDGRKPRSVCEITVRHETSTDADPVEAAETTLLHPITLDAAIVSFYSALPSVGALQQDPKLPKSVKSMWVSSSISREMGSTLRCDTTLLHDDAQRGTADITVYEDQTDNAVLTIQGIEMASLGRGSGAMAQKTSDSQWRWEQELCSKLVWGPDLSLRRPLALAQLKQQFTPVELDVDRTRDLERLCVYFARETLQTLTQDDVAKLQQQQDSHLARYYTWLRELAAEKGDSSSPTSSDEIQRLVASLQSKGIDGQLICHLGPLLPSILRNEVSLDEAVGPFLAEYNANSIRRLPALQQLSALLRKIMHKNPSARVLQIRSGSGWHVTESPLAALLAERADLLTFDELDISQNQNLSKTTLAPESYDVIIGFQALHNKDAGNTTRVLANVRSLLKPGGTLLLAETTGVQVDVDFVFGLVPDWWQEKGTDAEIEAAVVWDRVLRDAGLSGADLVLQDVQSDQIHSHGNIIMSTRAPAQEVGFAKTTSFVVAAAGTDAEIEHAVLGEANLDTFRSKIRVFLGEMDEPILADVDAVLMEGLRAMVTQCSGLLWITTGATAEKAVPERALHHGFLRVLRNEYIGRPFLSLDLDPAKRSSSDEHDSISATIVEVLEQAFGTVTEEVKIEAGPAELEYAERDGLLLVPRYYKDGHYNDMVVGPLVHSWGHGAENDETVSSIPLESFFQDRSLRLQAGIPGHLDTLAFVDDAKNKDLPSHLVKISPRSYGVCSRDVLAAMGQLKSTSAEMGFECAGIIMDVGREARENGYHVGDRVLALLPGSSFASQVRVPWHGVVPILTGMNWATAASVPLAFAIAYAALVDAAHLTAKQTVLVHAAGGAVGQAAIMMARHLGVEDIYATVGSPEERALVQQQYSLPADHVISALDDSFAASVLAATQGHGVDAVLHSNPYSLQASLDVLAPLGCLVETEKNDSGSNSPVPLESFSRGISFVSLDMSTVLRRRGPDIHRALSDVVRLFENHALKPVHPVTVYPMSKIEEAFRTMQTGKQMGKVVLSAEPDEQAFVVPRPHGVTPRTKLRPDASYLVVGGVGGIGRSVAHWLVAHGAKYLLLLSRSASALDLEKNRETSGARFIRELRGLGCHVKTISCDVALASSLTKAIKTCQEEDGFPPVRGVVQGAMLLRDAVFEQMTLADWTDGLRPKLYGTWNLHTEFAQPDALDFFVMLSSVSGVVGIASQTNYAAGGTYEDAMASWRQSHGLPAVAIDLGPISDIGFVSTSVKVADRLRKDGDFAMLDEDIVLRALHAAIQNPFGPRSQIIAGLNGSPGPYKAAAQPVDGNESRASLAAQLAAASDREEGARLVAAAVAAKLADIFLTPVEEIDLGKPPSHFGVDSLAAIEVRNMLVLQAAADISIFNILQTGSIVELADLVAEKSRRFADA
ncbi:polyketide synthase [Grosmannia clavigera kw1407]|uniref:Polyketide synthase n=1 Tax=Grosmannia clavigera (strain kw1407 / UAMH 11150) TaxID=655863 RepID=F0XBR7_GROCL|nr:polyketide synthase [Grosmannia clavigera kw1407]EFX05061.1 polyketide synthase [Grosmannia clavigera kw1407]